MTELVTAGASLPSGLIAIWKGSTSTIPNGWALCNGQNGTPDLRDKFVLGAGNSYGVGSTGGESTHRLTVSEMPSHTHDTSGSSATVSLGLRDGGQNSVTANRSKNIQDEIDVNLSLDLGYSGGSSAHNNMPPYYALCYIMKM